MPRTNKVPVVKNPPKWQTDPLWALRRAIRKGRLSSDIEKVFAGNADVCLRYAREVIRGRLPDFLEESLLDAFNNNSDTSGHYGNDRIRNWLFSYADVVGPLPDAFHNLLIKKSSENRPYRRNLVSYAKRFEVVPKELEDLLYADYNSALEYALATNKKLPEKVEKYVIKNCDDDDVVNYAKKIYKGRLPESLEKELTDHPEMLYRYAKEIMFGQLPNFLHSAMVMKSFDEDDEWVKGTIKSYMNFVKRSNNYAINLLRNLDQNLKVSDVLADLGEIDYEVESDD